MKSILWFLLSCMLLPFPFHAQAKLIQIIHTNDLHSYFEGYKDGRGGYARLKNKIDELRQEAASQGIEILQLDAGDFGEGTAFFLTDRGANSMKALGILGIDAAVVGNHDHMMGGKILGEQIRRANIKTKIISANLIATPQMELGNLVKPYSDFIKSGIPLRVIGLSTAEPHYQYPLIPGFIRPPVTVGDKAATDAKLAGKKLVIALTHIGQSMDIKLARGTSDIDIIIGGHSHTRMDKVMWIKNKKNRQVPIVQASAHGLVVGTLLIDVDEEGTVKVIKYKLHDIKAPMSEDPVMAQLVDHAVDARNAYFNGRWDEIIGETIIPFSGVKDAKQEIKESCWGDHMARMSRDATAADMGIHIANFQGTYVSPGPVTLGNMVDNFPHIRNYGENGWEISTINVSGKSLTTLIRAFANIRSKLGINFHGMSYSQVYLPKKVPEIGGRIWAFNIKVNGRSIRDDQRYTIAFPAEIAHAVKVSIPIATQVLFPGLANSGKFYWDVMEAYIKKNSPIRCL